MAAINSILIPSLTLEEIASDGSTLTNPAADHRRLFLGEDGLLHLRDSAGTVTDIGGGSSLTVEDEGTPLATAATTLDFVGAGVTVTGAGAEKTITIPGGGASSARAARAARTTNQSISNATWTGVEFNEADTYDTNTIHDPSSNNTRFVLNATGYWSVKLRAQFVANGTGDRYLAIYLNGVQYGHTQRVPGNGTIGNVLLHVDDVQATAITDYVECFVYQDSTGALNLATANCAVSFIGA